MRRVTPLLLLAAVGACSTAPPPPTRDARAEATLARWLKGKVPGAPQACLPSWRGRQMKVIDESTIAFREGSNRVWIQRTQNPCNLLGVGSYALLTRSTQPNLCRGDIGTVVDTLNGTTVGSCVMGDFIPYAPPGM